MVELPTESEPVRVLHGDCRAVLPTLAAGSFDSVVTDPPYDLGFMGKSWDKTGVAFDPETWRAVLRVLRPGGYMLACGGSRTYHRLTCAVEDAGFEVRDCIMWLYGCLSDDTELLTSEGWMPYSKITTDHLALAYNSNGDSFGWERVQEVVTYDYSDTAYRIQSDHTDQIVSRNHRCLVEHGGNYAFQYAETLQREVGVPVLEDVQGLLEAVRVRDTGSGETERDLLAGVHGRESAATEDQFVDAPAGEACSVSVPDVWIAGRGAGETGSEKPQDVLLAVVPGEGERRQVASAQWEGQGGLDGRIARQLPGEDERGEEPGVEGRGDVLRPARQLRECEVRQVSGGVPADGPQGRVCSRTPVARGTSYWAVPDSHRDGPPRRPQPDEQRTLEPDAVRVQPGSQVVRGARHTRPDLARVTPFHYVGTVWCIRIPSGAFVARRNGKVFVTGNSGFPKGKGCLKPAYEPIVLARKPGPKVLSLAIEECRVPTAERLSGSTVPNDIRGNRYAQGHKPGTADMLYEQNPAGRYPANVVIDDSECVAEAFAAFGETTGNNWRKNKGNGIGTGYGGSAAAWAGPRGFADTGTAARFFYCAKASRSERGEGNTHPTVKPLALARWLVRLVTPPAGRVLDPFAGSGTTLVAAAELGFAAVGIESNPAYVEVARGRLAESPGSLFAGVAPAEV